MKQPTIARLHELFEYDPVTGIITRKITVSSRAKAGDVVGSKNDQGYLLVSVDGRKYGLHRIAFALFYGRWPTALVDHINGVGSDNRSQNLREATKQQNNVNRRLNKTSTTGFKGVSARGKRFRAFIGGHPIGTFDTPEIAHAAYCQAAQKLFGEFARFS